MHNKLGRKVLHGVVMLSMVLSLAPVFSGVNVAQAAVPTMACSDVKPGMFLKVEGKPAIFGMSSTGATRFWGEGYIAKSWFNAYKDMNYKYVTQDCIRSLATPKASPYGMALASTGVVKYDEFDQLYVVEPGNAVAPVSKEVAQALYGTNFTVSKVSLRDWPDQALCKKTEYTEKLPSPGQVIKVGSTYYWVNYGKKLHEITANGMTANHKLMSLARVWPETVKTSFTMGDKVDGYMAMIGDVHQEGWDCNANPTMGTWTQPTGVITNPTSTIPGSSLNVSGTSLVSANQQISNATAYNKLLKVTFTAGNTSDIRVKGLTITKLGVSANTGITGISVWDVNGQRYGDVLSSLNSNNQVTIGFASNPLVVAKGTSADLYVAMNVSSSVTSGQLGASINAVGDVMTDAASVNGSFPLKSELAGIFNGASQLGQFTVTAQSPGGNSGSGSAGNVAVGDTKEIAKFKFTNNSTNNNPLTISNLTFYLEGTVKDKDFSHFTVVAPDNTVLGSTDYSSNRYVTINLTKPYTISQGQNRTLTVKANVDNGSGNWIRLHLQNDYDVMVHDDATNYFVLPNPFSDQSASDGYFAVKSGTINLSKSSDSPSGSISAGATGVVLARFDATAVGEDIEVRKMGIQITTSGPIYALSGNITIRALDPTTGIPTTLLNFSASDNNVLYNNGSQRNLSSYLVLKAGQVTKIEVVGDINASATSTSYTVRMGDFYGKRLSTLDFADAMPTTSPSSTAANTLTVQSSNLTLTKDTSFGNKNIGTGGTFVVGQYIARDGNAEDIRLTNLTFKFTGTASAPNHLQNMELWAGDSVSASGTLVNGTKVASTINSPATSSNSFSLDLTIPKNTQKILQVRVYVLSSANANDTVISQVDSITYVGKDTLNATTDSTSDPAGQTMTISAANVVITAINDSTTASRIQVPSDTQVQLGKWQFQSQNDSVSINKLTLWLLRPDGNVNTSSGEFGTPLALYDGSDMTTPLATASYVPGQGNGYVQFVKTGMLTVQKDQYKTLVLMGPVSHSGTMNPATTSAWGWLSRELNAGNIATTGSTYLDIRSLSGSQLTGAAIDFGSAGASVAAKEAVTSTFYLYHNAAPKVTPLTISGGLIKSTAAPLYKFRIDNPGDVPLRIGSITTTMAVTGLQYLGASGTSTVSGFALYLDNAGALGQQLSTTTLIDNLGFGCISGNVAGNLVTPSVALHGNCVGSTSTLNVTFNAASQVNNGFSSNSPIILPGGSLTFWVTANTTQMDAVKNSGNSGSVTLGAYGQITGSTGFSSGDATAELNWANGNISYYYTPTAGSENSTAYVASDSYGQPTVGNNLQYVY